MRSTTLLTNKAIVTEMDIVLVRKLVKEHTVNLKFRATDQTKLITASSEIARNTLKYGGGGEMVLSLVEEVNKKGLQLIFTDKGPGIADIELALRDGYTSGQGMGLGLGGTKRLVNEFNITSTPGEGTCITILSWSNS